MSNRKKVELSEGIAILVKHLSRYINLDSKEIDHIRQHANLKVFEKNDFLAEAGKVCRYENYIIEGCTYTYLLDNVGKKHVLRFAVADWWATDLGSFNNRQPAKFNIRCLEKTVALQFSYNALTNLYTLVPALESFFRIATQKAFIATQNRIANNLSLPAIARYQCFIAQYPKIEQQLPQYLIASYLGITKQFLSKIRAERKNG